MKVNTSLNRNTFSQKRGKIKNFNIHVIKLKQYLHGSQRVKYLSQNQNNNI